MVVDNPVSFKKVEQIRLTILQTMQNKLEWMDKKRTNKHTTKINTMNHIFQSGWIQWIKESQNKLLMYKNTIGIKDHEKIGLNAKKNMIIY